MSWYFFLKVIGSWGKGREKKKPQQYLEQFQSASGPRRVNFFARVNTASTLSHRWHHNEAVASNHLLENYKSSMTSRKRCLDQVSMGS